MDNKTKILLILGAIVLVAFIFYQPKLIGNIVREKKLTDAISLIEKNNIKIAMTEDCIACIRQKAEFGIEFNKLYKKGVIIKCEEKQEFCKDEWIPRWIKDGKTIYTGYLSLEEIITKFQTPNA